LCHIQLLEMSTKSAASVPNSKEWAPTEIVKELASIGYSATALRVHDFEFNPVLITE
jgi:hypothetical protein